MIHRQLYAAQIQCILPNLPENVCRSTLPFASLHAHLSSLAIRHLTAPERMRRYLYGVSQAPAVSLLACGQVPISLERVLQLGLFTNIRTLLVAQRHRSFVSSSLNTVSCSSPNV